MDVGRRGEVGCGWMGRVCVGLLGVVEGCKSENGNPHHWPKYVTQMLKTISRAKKSPFLYVQKIQIRIRPDTHSGHPSRAAHSYLYKNVQYRYIPIFGAQS